MTFSLQISRLRVLQRSAELNGKPEETYFLILHSENLLKIRRQIYQDYLANGGPAQAWNPDHYYPHITVGYSLRDLHEAMV